MHHFLIFGSHPPLSLAEARSILGGPAPLLMEEMTVYERNTWNGDDLQNRLGGVTKMGDIIAEVPVKELTAEHLAEILSGYPRGPGKVIFGISFFGDKAGTRPFKNLPIGLKRALQAQGLKVRWFTDEQGSISPAAVAKLHMIDEGYDICIGVQKNRAWVGLTRNVQNADTWSERDFGRPFRDRKVGMLPPKLARLMVNLSNLQESWGGPAASSATLLDPFCGGGTILMEGALLGYQNLIGSDIDSTQINGSIQNLDWLMNQGWISNSERGQVKFITASVETIDKHVTERIDRIVTEGYLGKPLRGDESQAFLNEQKRDIEAIWGRALPVLARLQPKDGIVICIWPSFRTNLGMAEVDASQVATSAGYEVVDPLNGWLPHKLDLMYARADQHVQRRIVVLRKRGE